jgi:perosamine synthetase
MPDTWCIDPDKAEAAISSKTKAIVAVHLYGNLCNMDRLLAIGEKYGIPIIEDAAEAIGSVYHGKRAGSMGKFGAFSFHGTKTLTTGEGGMFVTSDGELFEKVLTLSNHGRARDQVKQFWPDVVGFKYKMSNVQAAIGCGQMERIDILVNRKREIFQIYKRAFECISRISMNPESKNTINGAWMPTIVFDASVNFSREKLLNIFSSENIDARVFFWPLSSLPMFQSSKINKISLDLPSRAVNLPSYHDMETNDIERIITIIKNFSISIDI